MKFSTALVGLASLSGANAFTSEPLKQFATSPSQLSASPLEDFMDNARKTCTSFAAAAAIAVGATFGDIPLQAANAATVEQVPQESIVELSRGAFVVQTSAKAEALVKTEIDSKSLVKTLFVNRKELTTSIGRIQQAIQKEFDETPVWKELQKEILDIEGDVVPTFAVQGPSDWKQAVQDITSGKLNFLVNGEVFNVAVEPSFGDKEDDLVVRIKGYKGDPLPFAMTQNKAPERVYGPITTFVRSFDDFWRFWDEPYPEEYLLKGMKMTNGQVLLTGTVGTIWLAYAYSYKYYIDQLEEEERAAREKKEALAAKKKAKAAAAKKDDAAKEKDDKADKDAKKTKKQKELNEFKKELQAEKASSAASSGDESDSDSTERKHRIRFWKNKK